MRTPLLICLMAVLATALMAPAALAIDIKIDDTVNSDWITVAGTWTTGTSSNSKYGNTYYYCNQSPSGENTVTFTPDIPIDGLTWEVYVWYSAGVDRAIAAKHIVHRDGFEDVVVPVNQQQNGGMWVNLGSFEMPSGTSNYIRVSNEGTDTYRVVVADAIRLYAVGGDQLPPIISNVAATPGSASVVVRWDTDEPATSQVEYGKTTNYGYFSEKSNVLVTHHEVSITGLESEQTYRFKVRSEDGAGNLSVSSGDTFKTLAPDDLPPIIRDIVVVPGANSAVVMWLTDEPATSLIEYGTTSQYGSSTPVDSALVKSHQVTITGLNNSTTYYFRVKSADGSGNMGTSDGSSFVTSAADNTAPAISDVAAQPRSTSAVITWKTNEYATSRVQYGRTASYGSTTQEDLRFTLNHAVSLANLEPSTTYHYRVISRDGSGNIGMSLDHLLTTPAVDSTGPEISQVVAVPGSTSCVITWITNEPSTSVIRYGLTEAADDATESDDALVIQHSLTLTELIPSTDYKCFVGSADAEGNLTEVGLLYFTTKAPDQTAPEITEVAADPESNSAVITWLTNEPTTSLVEYGETTEYGSTSAVDANMVTSHRVLVTGLAPSTTYYYRVRSADAGGNEAISPGFVFTTDGPDLTPPLISQVSVSRNINSAIVRWHTNEFATSQVEYGLTSEYGIQTTPDIDLENIHGVTLTGLEPSTLYHFRVISTDGAGNTAVSGDYTFETSATEPEYRMIWADTWHNGFLSAAETTAFIDTVAAANFNAVVVEVRKAGDAYYMSGYEPWASNIDPPAGAYDPLQDLIDKAHAKGIEVHAWIVTYRAWYKTWPAPPDGHVYKVHGPGTGLYQDWSMRNSTGGFEEGNSLNIDPGVPGVQDYLTNIVKDIVTKYPLVDGINFDYVRYPGVAWGYNETTKERFRLEYGFDPPTLSTDPNWGTWCDYRRTQVTDLVRKCFVEAMAINPRIKMSVDTVGWEGADPSINFEGTPQYMNVFQDAKSWMHEHIVDLNILMNYKREFNSVQKPNYRLWADWLPRVANSSGRLAVDGQGVYLNAISGSITQMLYSRNAGADGMCAYSYAVTNKDGQPASDFFTAVKTNLYDSPAPIPDMPWKYEPTTGIIFGTVTYADQPNDPIYGNWAYQAYVTLRGPVEREALSDATGSYAFLDLPQGSYTVSISKPGFRVQAFGGLMVEPGQILRQDAALDSGMFTSPAGTIRTGWNLLSVPVQPLDPQPQVVFSGLPLEGNLMGWDNPTQAQLIYSPLTPEAFGGIHPNEGYWFISDRNTVISYEPAQVEPPTQVDIAIPRTGWTILGCPFLTPRDWNQASVTHGDRTVTIRTARNWGWIDTICWWWDNSIPGGALSAIGLDDEWMESSTLQPWHGYWLQTFIDDIVLTLR